MVTSLKFTNCRREQVSVARDINLTPSKNLAQGAFVCELRKNADRIITFSPFRDPQDLTIPDPQTMTGGPFLWKDILPRERGGYPVTVYRIRS